MTIIKVDIQTGEVMENNLREFWARESMGRNSKGLVRQPHSMERPCPRTEKVDPALMKRVKRFSSRVNRRANSWKEEELYQLAVLMGRKKMPYKHAGLHLTRSPHACRYMYREMKKAGVI